MNVMAGAPAAAATGDPNGDWLQRSRRAVWHPCTQMKVHETLPLVPIARGAGAWLFDFDGAALPRCGELVVGQPVRARQSADQRRARRPARRRSSTRCSRGSRTGPWSSCRSGSRRWRRRARARVLRSDGASATEIALKMAFHTWRNRGRAGKTRFVEPRRRLPRRDAGRAGGDRRRRSSATPTRRCCSATTGSPSPDAAPCRAGRVGARASPKRAAAALEAHLARHHATTAALIVEPLVQGATGMAMHDAHYLARARELCTRATTCC